MTGYRLFFINNVSGRIDRAEVVEAPDDGGAVRTSESRAGPQAMELWHLARRVHCFDPGFGSAEPTQQPMSSIS